MDKLTVKGLGGIDGDYEFSLAALLEIDNPETITQREAHKIKQATGLRLGELEDAMESGDADVVIAVALVVLDRAGKRYDLDTLWKAPLGSLIIDTDEDDAVPLTSSANGSTEPTAPAETSGGGSGGPPSDSPNPSGPSRTGSPPSETGSGRASVPATSVI